MNSELYKLYNSAKIERIKFNADDIVKDLHDWYGVDIDDTLTTPTSVVLNVDKYKEKTFSMITAINKKYSVAVKSANGTVVFKGYA